MKKSPWFGRDHVAHGSLSSGLKPLRRRAPRLSEFRIICRFQTEEFVKHCCDANPHPHQPPHQYWRRRRSLGPTATASA